VTYLESARRAQRLPARWICPGHGAPFARHAEHVEKLLGLYARRQDQLWSALGEGARCALELVPALFGRVLGDELFLQISEVVGNLEVLEAEGRVGRRFDGAVYRYFRLGPQA
jgi:hypothetical protein